MAIPGRSRNFKGWVFRNGKFVGKYDNDRSRAIEKI